MPVTANLIRAAVFAVTGHPIFALAALGKAVSASRKYHK
jgi:hypothetical protein